MRILSTLTLLVCLAISASPAAAQLWEGTYVWVSTEIEGGVVETPGSVGYEVELQITDDGGVFEYQDGALIDVAPWWANSFWVGNVCMTEIYTGLGGEMAVEQDDFLLTLRSIDTSPARTELYMWYSPVDTDRETLDSVKARFVVGALDE